MRSNIPSMSSVVNRRPVRVTWDEWAKGLNRLVNSSKIEDSELAEATNILLEDAGNPIKRWGSGYYGNDSSGTKTTGLMAYYNSNGTRFLLKIENGIMKKLETNNTWSVIGGASFASGQRNTSVLLNDTLYISNGTDNLTKFNGSTLSRFTALAAPTSSWSTRGSSLVSGQYLHSYKISALSAVGETLAAAGTTIAVDRKRSIWNVDPAVVNANYSATITWTPVSGAVGYNIYGYIGGDETYLDTVTGVNTWTDYGTKEPSSVFTLPVGDTTRGPKGKYIIEYKSALIISGDPTAPSRVYYSAGVDKPESFLISDGGGWLDVAKNANDGVVTGLAPYQNRLIIFKERSIWAMDFTSGALASLTNIQNGFGCLAHDTIKPVENDLYFVGRKAGGGPAIYVLGNEANYLTTLRTNELSAKLRPVMETILPANFSLMQANYFQGKYFLYLPTGNVAYNNAAAVYDHEHKGFTYWSGINADYSVVFYDANNAEKFVFLDGADNRVSYLDENLSNDKGTPIEWRYRTKDLDLESVFDWKKNKWINLRLRQASGLVTFRIWLNGNTVGYEYNLQLQSSNLTTSFRGEKFGVGKFKATVSGNSTAPEDITTLRLPLKYIGDKMNAKSVGLEIVGTADQSRAGLLEVEFVGMPRSKNFYPRTEIIYN